MKSLGFVEVSGVVAAIDALDIMLKSSNVKLLTWERKLGGRLVTVIIEGTVSDVTEAIENAKAKCISDVRASNVIANPHSETQRLVELSASRIAKKNGQTEEKKAETADNAVQVNQTTTAKKKTTSKKTKTNK